MVIGSLARLSLVPSRSPQRPHHVCVGGCAATVDRSGRRAAVEGAERWNRGPIESAHVDIEGSVNKHKQPAKSRGQSLHGFVHTELADCAGLGCQ